MNTDPTDAQLDEIEVLVNRWRVHRTGDMHNLAGRLIKALRACRKQSELVVENLDGFRAPIEVGDKKLSIAGRVFALEERDEACRKKAKTKDAVLKLFADEANWTEWEQKPSGDPCEVWDLERRFDLPPQEIARAALDKETDDA